MKKLIFITDLPRLGRRVLLIWDNSPEYIKQGGPLLVLGLTFSSWPSPSPSSARSCCGAPAARAACRCSSATSRQPCGEGDLEQRGRRLPQAGRLPGQRDRRRPGALPHGARQAGANAKELLEETRRALQEASALESPILERNLTALSTIASIATMLGLLGTTIGMIRSFHAMSHAGAPDADAAGPGHLARRW